MPTIRQLHRLQEAQFEFPEMRTNHSGNGFGLLPDRKPLTKYKRCKGRAIGYYIINPNTQDLRLIIYCDRYREPPQKPTEKSFFKYHPEAQSMIFDGKKLIVVPKTDSQ